MVARIRPAVCTRPDVLDVAESGSADEISRTANARLRYAELPWHCHHNFAPEITGLVQANYSIYNNRLRFY